MKISYVLVPLICILCILFLFSRCEFFNKDYKMAVKYVESKGYKIESTYGKVKTYKLTKSILIAIDYSMVWGVQKADPDIYLGKTIDTYRFIVTNHPLDQLLTNTSKQTILSIMIADHEVIGGYSYPNAYVEGGMWSIDGKTQTEVTGMSTKEWWDMWLKKYKEN